MTKHFALTLFLFSIVISSAQSTQFGIRGGVNYNYSGDILQWNEIESRTFDVMNGAENKNGFHAGVFFKLRFSDMFLKTEAQYSKFENSFATPSLSTLKTQKIDIPLLFGLKIFGPVYAYVGPDFQFIIDEDFSLESHEINYDSFSTGLNLGLGIEYKRIALEVRWDRGLKESEIAILNIDTSDYNYTLDNRPNQLLFSIQFALFDKD